MTQPFLRLFYEDAVGNATPQPHQATLTGGMAGFTNVARSTTCLTAPPTFDHRPHLPSHICHIIHIFYIFYISYISYISHCPHIHHISHITHITHITHISHIPHPSHPGSSLDWRGRRPRDFR